MAECSACGANLKDEHMLESSLAALKNGYRVIKPRCGSCKKPIDLEEIENGIKPSSRVLLISGAAGSGKSAIGQYLERAYGYTFIDGDAINHLLSRRYRSRLPSDPKGYLCHDQVIRTMLITLGLGYNVVVSYVIEFHTISLYDEALKRYGVKYEMRILTPSREACLERDRDRPCWNAGEWYVDRWFSSIDYILLSAGRIYTFPAFFPTPAVTSTLQYV